MASCMDSAQEPTTGMMTASSSICIKEEPLDKTFSSLPGSGEDSAGLTAEHTVMTGNPVVIKTEPYNTVSSVALGNHEDEDELGADRTWGYSGYNESPFLTDPFPSQGEHIEDSETSVDSGDRLDTSLWCSCGRCRPTEEDENLCCRDVDEATALCDEEVIQCITEHELFSVLCLHRKQLEMRSRVLKADCPIYMERCGKDDNTIEYRHRVLRFTAYREFAYIVWGGLSKRNRRHIPGCALRWIREAFPSTAYTQFGWA